MFGLIGEPLFSIQTGHRDSCDFQRSGLTAELVSPLLRLNFRPVQRVLFTPLPRPNVSPYTISQGNVARLGRGTCPGHSIYLTHLTLLASLLVPRLLSHLRLF